MKKIIEKSSVNFSESNTKLDSCKIYLEGKLIRFNLQVRNSLEILR